jgi:hypothetical protein
MEMDAKIEAGAEIYTKAEVQFSASILGVYDSASIFSMY